MMRLSISGLAILAALASFVCAAFTVFLNFTGQNDFHGIEKPRWMMLSIAFAVLAIVVMKLT